MERKYFFVFAAILILTFSAFVVAKPKWKNPCPINSDTNVVFYGDTGFGGVGSLSKSWIIHFLDWWETQDPSINYVELDANDVKGDCNFDDFPNIEVYIQPGGNAYYQQNSLDAAGKNAITNYINSGKGYVGICAGWYYTANDYWWQDEYFNHPNLLELYPTVEGSIREIADYEGNPDHTLTPLSNGFNAIYYGGPTRGYEYTSLDYPGVAEATFTAYGNRMPALIKYNNLLLTSVHLEAFENDGISELSTEDRVENYKLLGNLINEISGSNFYVPAYTNPPVCGNEVKESGEVCDGTDLGGETCQLLGFDDGTLSCLGDCLGFDTSQCIDYPSQCSDGIDNDGDNLTDFPADPGCDDADDDNEIDVIGPVEIFSDGFEDGNIDGWTTYGTGAPWSASTDTSYEGSWSARAKKTGAGDDSFIETSIDASGYSNLTFEYYRRLVGLDAADDFEVQYFDGSWHTLEHLGTGRASDSSFKLRSFNIPSSTTALRFKCECGAVSEKCYVDNVRVIAQ